MAKFASVDEYLASLEPGTATTVRSLIEAAVAVHQDLDVKLSWNVPQVHLGKHYVMGFGPAKRHISIAPWSKDVMVAFADRIAVYDPTDNMLRVPIDWTVDTQLIADLVRARLSELSGISRPTA